MNAKRAKRLSKANKPKRVHQAELLKIYTKIQRIAKLGGEAYQHILNNRYSVMQYEIVEELTKQLVKDGYTVEYDPGSDGNPNLLIISW